MDSRFGRKLALAMCLAAVLCLFATIGVNQASASYCPPQESSGWDIPQSPGYLTIAGTWKYYDRDNDLVPAEYFLVELLTAADEHLAWDYTNNSGYFCFEPVPNPGVKIRVKIYTYRHPGENCEIMVVQPDGSSWDDAYSYPKDKGPYSDGYHDVGTLVVPSWLDELDAWWIKDDLQKGFWKAPDPAGDYIAEWDPDWNRPSMFCVCHLIDWPCDTIGHVQLAFDAAEDGPDMVLHEMGHNVMWNVYDGYWPIPCWRYGLGYCIEHYIPLASGDKCAWTEGWADFWAIYVKGSPYLFAYNLETPTWGTPDYWEEGDDVEGRVAGALWDIYDSPADYWDQHDGDFDDIWDTFCDGPHDTFEDFWGEWKVGKSDEVFFDANGSLYQNTIEYDDDRLVLGDANEDEVLSAGDITKVERIMLELDPPTVGADANKDGKINSGDITKIELIMLGLDC